MRVGLLPAMNEVAGDAGSDGRKRRAKATPKGPSRLKKQKSVRALGAPLPHQKLSLTVFLPVRLPDHAWCAQVNERELAQE